MKCSTRVRDRSKRTGLRIPRSFFGERGAKPLPATVHVLAEDAARLRLPPIVIRVDYTAWTLQPTTDSIDVVPGPQTPRRASRSIAPPSPTCSVSGALHSAWSSADGPWSTPPRTTPSAPGIRSSGPSSTGEPSIDRGMLAPGTGRVTARPRTAVPARPGAGRRGTFPRGSRDSCSCRTCSRRRKMAAVDADLRAAVQAARPGDGTSGGRRRAAARPTPAGSSTSQSSRRLCGP